MITILFNIRTLLIGLLLSSITIKVSQAQEIDFYIHTQPQSNPVLIKSLQLEFNNANLAHIKVKNTHFWHPYIQGLRQGKKGFYLAAPHFSAWTINKHQFIPLIKLAGTLQYVLISRRNDINIFEVNDLARKRICASKAPNLDFILANNALQKSLNSPQIIAKESAFHSMRSNDNQCDAFVISEHLFKQYSLQQPFEFIRLQESQTYPNYAFLSSPNIDPAIQFKFKKIIMSKNVQTLLKPVFDNYSSKPILLSANNEDYSKVQNPYLEKIWAK